MKTQRILMRSLAVVFFASVIWTITDAQNKDITCCKVVSRQTREQFPDPIIGFRVLKHNNQCLKAVVFKTERGEFCFDGRLPWVDKEAKKFFRAQRNKSLTSTTPPPASSISKRLTSTPPPASSISKLLTSTSPPASSISKLLTSTPPPPPVSSISKRLTSTSPPASSISKRLTSTSSPASSIISADADQKAGTYFTEVSRRTREEFPDPIIGFRMSKRNHQCQKASVFKTERGEFCFDRTQQWVKEGARQFFRAQRNKSLSSTRSQAKLGDWK